MLQDNEKYCKDCGKVIHVNAEICPNCGVRQMPPPTQEYLPAIRRSDDQKWLITLLLCFFGGMIGLHNFYNRKIGYGILQIITFGGLGIWVLVDLIMIVTNNFRDKEGNYITYN